MNKTEVTRLTPSEKQFIEQLRELATPAQTEKTIEKKVAKPIMKGEGSRVLIIGDLHTPFDLDTYFDHCVKVYQEFQCDEVVFIGDVIDQHFASFHTADPDGMGAGQELEYAKQSLQRWHEQFPHATVILGNHDRIVARKAFEGGVPKAWIRDYHEVLETPTWEYTLQRFIDGVEYVHGEGGTARTRIKNEAHSIVQGHLHTQAYIEWAFSGTARKFGMQVGTGIDSSAYAFGYAKAGKKPAVSCGVVLNGTQPFLIPMDL